TLLKNDDVLRERWDRAIDLAFQMSDNEQVKPGTRYDALRMVAMADWDRSRPMLEKYLAEGVHAELQMGAVSGLVDVPEPAATELLLGAVKYLPARNRDLALDGLLKSNERISQFLQALESDGVDRESLGPERWKLLQNHADPSIRRRAATLSN
ncbi:MAG TPA: hypothetical protein VLA12_09070, partial [Planctomycetaceae bacterium]|nr:hypothetical protein [Planctomycetaceae bacterium]